MKSNHRYIQEYIRVMNSVDMKEVSTKRIIRRCSRFVPESRTSRGCSYAVCSGSGSGCGRKCEK